jgi:hypothetical protein
MHAEVLEIVGFIYNFLYLVVSMMLMMAAVVQLVGATPPTDRLTTTPPLTIKTCRHNFKYEKIMKITGKWKV